mgnify:CR=1 FL=1
MKYPAGSCLVSFGDTKVLCCASISEEVPRFLQDTGSGWVTAEYAMLPGSTGGSRKPRELMKRDGRSIEIQRLIGRSLRSSVDLALLGPVTIIIDCDVIQADGGTRTAAISGGWVALRDALTVLASRQGLAGKHPALIGQVAAVSTGIVDGKVVCDLDYAHDSRAEVDMNVVMREDELIEVQGTGERNTFTRVQLDDMLDAAWAGIQEIYKKQQVI